MSPIRYTSVNVSAEPLTQKQHFQPSGRIAKNNWGQGKNNRGVIVTGNIDIENHTLGAIGSMVITPEDGFEGERFEKFIQIAAAGKADGSLMVGQVVHAGRQLQSRITNRLTDEYGPQTIESRLVAQAIKARVPSDFIVGAKLNSVEFQDGAKHRSFASPMDVSLQKRVLSALRHSSR